MYVDDGQSHVLTGLPAVAIEFAKAMQHNRARLSHDAGLSVGELLALFRVGAETRLTPKQLAAHLNMTTPAITYISRRLVDLGLLHRVDHPGDRRSLYLELTPEAHRMMRAQHRDFALLMQDATSDLTAAELDSFIHRLHSVARSVMLHSTRSLTLEETDSRPILFRATA